MNIQLRRETSARPDCPDQTSQPTARAAAPMLTDLFLVMKTFVVIVQYRGALLLARVILRRSVDNITG
jgi:hypothetical protein